ncbi:Hsp70 family protein [Ramlibacter terrae]|uniref:Hsp70 family protein n=1 Tax=Ramlibacter terrae TaxID=2732511 RepID=A0ABX6P237_9BURK|nr:Hsp70 family protein [Ramlibacter terrae]
MSLSRTLGIDFGTSNCTAYAQDAQGRVVPVPLEGDETLLPTVAFASWGEDADHRPTADQTFLTAARRGTVLFGTPALQAYIADPLAGTLVRSPKAFLGSDLPSGYVPVFTDVIARILVHIKQRAEDFTGGAFTRAVVGRPVHYNGVLGARGDDQAIAMMEAALQAAGFAEWSFVAEPVAACLKFEQTLEKETVVLVVDVGGGTTDCAVVRARPAGSTKRSRAGDVLGFSGDRVGGTDFDQSLAWSAFMPLFGRGMATKDGRPLPHGVLADAVSTRSVPAQLRFRAAGREIAGCCAAWPIPCRCSGWRACIASRTSTGWCAARNSPRSRCRTPRPARRTCTTSKRGWRCKWSARSTKRPAGLRSTRSSSWWRRRSRRRAWRRSWCSSPAAWACRRPCRRGCGGCWATRCRWKRRAR